MGRWRSTELLLLLLLPWPEMPPLPDELPPPPPLLRVRLWRNGLVRSQLIVVPFLFCSSYLAIFVLSEWAFSLIQVSILPVTTTSKLYRNVFGLKHRKSVKQISALGVLQQQQQQQQHWHTHWGTAAHSTHKHTVAPLCVCVSVRYIWAGERASGVFYSHWSAANSL